MNIGFLLMSGGLSSRMGQPKALLSIGGERLIDRIARAGEGFGERILSVNDPAIPTPEGFTRVADVYKECGPMGGLHAALSACQSDALVCAPCDAPLYTAEAAAFLAAQLEDGVDAVILTDDAGRAHPMMGAYAKTCLPHLTRHLEEGHFKLMRMLNELNVRFVPAPEAFSPSLFSNLNTPEDYERVRRDAIREGVLAIAKGAGEIILGFGDFSVEEKEGHANFVTDVDCAVQDYLQSALTRLIPGSAFIGEEKENDALTDAPTWIIDPVDGTTNLIHNLRTSAVSIALCEGGRPVLGAVYQPYTDEMFFAELGRGAFLNGHPIHVSATPFERALVAFGTSPYNPELAKTSMSMALSCLQNAADVRRSGSAALDLASVACGRSDAFFELTLKPWDYAAGALLVTEAGGKFLMPLCPEGVRFDRPEAILAVNSACEEGMLSLFHAHCAK